MVNGDGVWDVVGVEDARALDVCDVSAGGTKQCTMLRVPPQPDTVRLLRANTFAQSSLAPLSKCHMCQRAAVVNQSLFPPVFNMTDNEMNKFNVSGVKGPLCSRMSY